ncbi:MAG TPA: CDP-glucose 4,6-dehydratase [Steroidobacteraceae bacterium]|nr:CDP-glucose 4,6-dehydratase [Steroidobacteraceae bacterium]
MNQDFWKNRRVAVTGHTGFKGPWLCALLRAMGAEIHGYSRPPPTTPSLYGLAGESGLVESDTVGDIRDTAAFTSFLERTRPEILLHMAAESVVLDSYRDPVEFFSTNAVGTASILEGLRRSALRCAVVNVTTDKVYANRAWVWGYRETDALGGNDPYSSSKACAELVAQSFRSSFFPPDRLAEHGVAIGTARAGNVIGGGDWTPHQLIPATVAAFAQGQPVVLRNPGATRPWQHVLDCLSGYLTLAEQLVTRPQVASGDWNFGPSDRLPPTVSEVVEILGQHWSLREPWVRSAAEHLHEERALSLDSSKAEAMLGWRARLDVRQALDWVASWYLAFGRGEPAAALVSRQVQQYLQLPVPAR